MSFSYSAILIAGVTITKCLIVTGHETRYSPDTGEPYDQPVRDLEMSTPSGTVFVEPDFGDDDEAADDWFNSEPGDFGLIGGEAETLVLGVLLGEITPRDGDAPEQIDPVSITSAMVLARQRLDDLGIADEVQLLLAGEAR